MARLKFLSAALIAAATLATPALARESLVSSRHLAESANAGTTPGASYFSGTDGLRDNHFRGGFGGTRGDGYADREVWGHMGTYYGPMLPTL